MCTNCSRKLRTSGVGFQSYLSSGTASATFTTRFLTLSHCVFSGPTIALSAARNCTAPKTMPTPNINEQTKPRFINFLPGFQLEFYSLTNRPEGRLCHETVLAGIEFIPVGERAGRAGSQRSWTRG